MESITDTKSGRTYRFEGKLLGSESTARPGRPRWSEMHLYRTTNGTYIVVKAGRSTVFHATRACAGVHAKDTPNSRHARIDGTPCMKCEPDLDAGRYFKESDFVSVFISKTAAGAVEATHTTDADGVLFMPHIAQRMLAKACQVDSDIADAYKVEVVL